MTEFKNYSGGMYHINRHGGVIVGSTDQMIRLFYNLNHLAELPTTVLLLGDTGTGKELFAKALHYNGPDKRRRGNFVAVNCAGIPPDLLESELFGHVKGSFTGAHRSSPGKFHHANGGTILLDEIGDMNPKLQAKVLRVLQDKQITPVGGTDTVGVDVRVVAATNKNLEEEVDAGRFRADLFYRLNVIPLRIPSLEERREDIPLIAEHLRMAFNHQYGASISGFSPEALMKLEMATWKGNVRELENVVERAFIFRRRGIIEAEEICFNSDMPSGILIPGYGNEDERWFSEGVLPISPREISKIDGSRSYTSLLTLPKEGVYVQLFGFGDKKRSPLVYLTPSNMSTFFNDTHTQGYRRLENLVRSGEFNTIARNPFRILSVSELVRDPDALTNNASIRDAIARTGAYAINVGNGTCFAMTYGNSSAFVARGPGSDDKAKRLIEKVDDAYQEFVGWSPAN